MASGNILVNAFYRDVSNAVTNINNLIATGKYRFGPNATGSPDSTSYGIVVVFSTDDVESTNNIWVFQTAYLTGGNVFSRRKINTNAWTSWRLISDSNYYKEVTLTYTTPADISSTYSYCYVNEATHHGMIQIFQTTALATNAYQVATLPAAYKPAHNWWGTVLSMNGGNVVGRVEITNDGKIYAYIPSGASISSPFYRVDFVY